MIVMECLLSCTPVLAQNLLSNGSFESPQNVANSASSEIPVNWSIEGNAPTLINGRINSDFPKPLDGQQFVLLKVANGGSPDGLSQTFTVTNSGTYRLGWSDTSTNAARGTAHYFIKIINTASQIVVVSNNYDAFRGSTDWVAKEVRLNLDLGTYSLSVQAQAAEEQESVAVDEFVLVSQYQNGTYPIEFTSTNIIVHWPETATNAILEASSLSSPIVWEAVTNQVESADGIRSVAIPFDQTSRFFRLKYR